MKNPTPAAMRIASSMERSGLRKFVAVGFAGTRMQKETQRSKNSDQGNSDNRHKL
jgi:hypothetical protein